MSTQTQTCVLVYCDECSEPLYGFEEGFIVHFDLGTNLEVELRNYDWLVKDDKYYCEYCVKGMQTFIAVREPAVVQSADDGGSLA